MAPLVDELRRLTGAASDQYTLDGDAYWTDGQFEVVLARHRRWQHGLPLEVAGVSSADESVTEALIVGLGGVVDTENPGSITDRDNLVIGGWTIVEDGLISFPEDSDGAFPLYWSGYAFDVHAAAAEVLDAWVAALAGNAYDVKIDGQEFKRSQVIENLRSLAAARRASSFSGSGGGIQSIPTRAEL